MIRLGLALGLLLPFLGHIVAEPQVRPEPFRGSITGVVREARTEQAMAGASVYLFEAAQSNPAPGAVPAVTNSDGRFTLEVRAPGTYRLLPEKQGWVYARPSSLKNPQSGVVVRVSPANETVTLELPMVQEGSISGKVLDVTSGQPVPFAFVSVTVPSFNSLGETTTATFPGPRSAGTSARTDDRGEFRLYGLQPGEYYLIATGAARVPALVFHPGTMDRTRATVIHVEEGVETRATPLLLDSRTTPVSLRFVDAVATRLSLSVAVLGTETGFGSTSAEMPRQMAVTLTPGTYDLLIQGRSRDNELWFGRETFEVATETVVREIRLSPGISVTGTMQLDDVDGKSLDPAGIQCRLISEIPTASAQSAPNWCLKSQVSAGEYRLEMPVMPPDAFVMSAKSGDRDVLRDGLRIDGPVHLDIALVTPGARIAGVVRDVRGNPLSHATVALVPDPPYRAAGPLYRVDLSTLDGTFELRGVGPGGYRIFAWADLSGAGYRNSEFMSKYEGMGKPLRVERAEGIVADLIVLD